MIEKDTANGGERDLFRIEDVNRAIEDCNFNKGLGPDGFDGWLI